MAGLHGVRAVVFDAYGTLFDVGSAAQLARDVLGDGWPAVADLWRSKQLQYTWLRSLMGCHADFGKVTADALDFALASAGHDDAALRSRLVALYDRLGAYGDARPVLERLRTAGFRLAILSNGSPRMLSAAAESAGISALLDHVLSVEEVGVYKPHPSVYQLAVDRLGIAAADIGFVSANGWDAFAASHFGFRVAWCNRARQPLERLPGSPDLEIGSLSDLPAALGLGD